VFLVRKGGLEPTRYCYRQPLKLVRLPRPASGRRRIEASDSQRPSRAKWVIDPVAMYGTNSSSKTNSDHDRPKLLIFDRSGRVVAPPFAQDRRTSKIAPPRVGRDSRLLTRTIRVACSRGCSSLAKRGSNYPRNHARCRQIEYLLWNPSEHEPASSLFPDRRAASWLPGVDQWALDRDDQKLANLQGHRSVLRLNVTIMRRSPRTLS